MNHDRMAVLQAMMSQGMIPVFYHPDVEVCSKVIQACANGGAKCIEFTNRGDFAAHTFLEVTRYIANGANFVVGPMTNPEVARICNRRGIAYSPGCGSATEISNAQELGCEIVKVFPGKEVGGPGFVKNVLGPMPWTKIMPTGGVESTEESLSAWLGAGVAAM